MKCPTVATYPELSMMANLDLASCQMSSSVTGSLRSAFLRMILVVGDENGCVAVALVVRVGGQLDDSVVCDAAAAGQVERPHHPRLI